MTLTADLDLTGSDFQPIPTFGGIFEGNGHQITGLELTENGSVQGFFRYIQPGGVVKVVTVSGNILPGGSKAP